MAYSSDWLFFAGIALLLGWAALPLFSAADTPPSPHADRLTTLDGLRGFLAFGVFFSHGVGDHAVLLHEGAAPLYHGFYELLGHVAVEMFFMITGYLFWMQLLRSEGHPDWLRLYVGRVFRIGPVFLLAFLVTAYIALWQTGFSLRVRLDAFAREVAKWLTLGLSFVDSDTINGYADTPKILLGVTWTLHFEWLFYLSLPLIALATRRRSTHLPIAATILVTGLVLVALRQEYHGADKLICVALFSVGMLCASLEMKGLTARLPDWLGSTLVALLLLLAFVFYEKFYLAGPIVLIGSAFYLICSGCSVFGVLTCRAARRLGNVSYSLYLLQGLVFLFVFALGPLRSFASGSPVQYWLTLLLCAALLVVVATTVHVAVERPGVELGKRVSAILHGQVKLGTPATHG